MGTPDGFLKYERKDAQAYDINERIKKSDEFSYPLSEKVQKQQRERCMN